MVNRFRYVFLMTAFAGSVLVGACGDDDSNPGGGEAGEPGASGANQSGTGGKGVSGSSVGGQGANGGDNGAGEGGSAVSGSGGTGGKGGSGGTGGTGGKGGTTGNGEAGGGGDGAFGGDGGSGGAMEPAVTYACGQATIFQKYCSATKTITCEPPAEACSDCVTAIMDERSFIAECPACAAQYDKGLQCAVTPFEAGNPGGGLVCDGGVFLTEECFEVQFASSQCDSYKAVHGSCPETWPLAD